MDNNNWIQDFATSLGIDLPNHTTLNADTANNIDHSADLAANNLHTSLHNSIFADQNPLVHPSAIHEPHEPYVWNQTIMRMESPHTTLSLIEASPAIP